MSFSNAEIKKTAVALKSQASQLTQLIGSAMQEADNVNLSAPGLPGDGGPQDLEAAPEQENLLGEALNGIKKIVEAFDFKRDVLDKKKDGDNGEKEDDKKDDDKEEIKEDATPTVDANNTTVMENIDLKESYKFMNDGTLKSSNFDAFRTSVVTALLESRVAKEKSTEMINGLSIINRIDKSKSITEINECFNALYDFADKNNIEIITE